jgi:translation initiation factor IF-2
VPEEDRLMVRRSVEQREIDEIREILSVSLIWKVTNAADRMTVINHILQMLDSAGLVIVPTETIEQLRESYRSAMQRYYIADDKLNQLRGAIQASLYGPVLEDPQ